MLSSTLEIATLAAYSRVHAFEHSRDSYIGCIQQDPKGPDYFYISDKSPGNRAIFMEQKLL
jgi:hypothetical protein